jgi:hypothetical protein
MQNEILANILDWSGAQPLWQRDALRRLFTAGSLGGADFDDLLELAKAKHGLAKARDGDPLHEAHLAIGDGSTTPVSLRSVTHHRGVNALAPEQTVRFGPSLTVVFGKNAAGKSGYARILKQACRSRSREEVLGNVLVDGVPVKGRATLHFQVGHEERSVAWTSDGVPGSALAGVSIFDSKCAPVYVRDRTDVAFRPFGLDVFDKLSSACSELRKRLEAEQKAISAPLPLPQPPAGSKVASLLGSLTALTNIDSLRVLTTVAPEEMARLEVLRGKQRDVQAADPRKLAQDLELKAGRIESLLDHLTTVADRLGKSAIEALRNARTALDAAKGALDHLRKTVLTADLLAGTGEQIWRRMWDAAGDYSRVAYPASVFPMTGPDAKCLLCQQPLGDDASERFRHFRELVTSSAQAELRAAERTLTEHGERATTLVVDPPAVTLWVDEVRADNAELADRIRSFLKDAATTQATIRRGLDNGTSLPARGIVGISEADLRAPARALRERAAQLRKQRRGMDPKEAQELLELQARVVLRDGLDHVLAEVERLKRVAGYSQCIRDTNTKAITRKNTELTTHLVTERLRETFHSEIRKVEFTHLAVELRSAGGERGSLYHQLAFTNAPGTPVAKVLSEGESRALSLAAFLSELSTAPASSAIIFDDPVSSLDHVWRERIARRLVAEAKTRQVIVFTHDLVFLKCLLAECDKLEVDFKHQYVRREGGTSGLCSEELPWLAMRVNDRIGVLRNHWQAAEKVSRTEGSDAYEREAREIYGLLREAWEQAVAEVLLNDVVERYRPSIETKRVRHLHDISEEDCAAVDDGMAECSRWIRGHDEAAADGTPFPQPQDLSKRINDLDAWAKRIRKRRERTRAPGSS